MMMIMRGTDGCAMGTIDDLMMSIRISRPSRGGPGWPSCIIRAKGIENTEGRVKVKGEGRILASGW